MTNNDRGEGGGLTSSDADDISIIFIPIKYLPGKCCSQRKKYCVIIIIIILSSRNVKARGSRQFQRNIGMVQSSLNNN